MPTKKELESTRSNLTFLVMITEGFIIYGQNHSLLNHKLLQTLTHMRRSKTSQEPRGKCFATNLTMIPCDANENGPLEECELC